MENEMPYAQVQRLVMKTHDYNNHKCTSTQTHRNTWCEKISIGVHMTDKNDDPLHFLVGRSAVELENG